MQPTACESGRRGLPRRLATRPPLIDAILAHAAHAAYERALSLTQQEPERRFLLRRLRGL